MRDDLPRIDSRDRNVVGFFRLREGLLDALQYQYVY